ncbi:Protein RESTRICTED TEV MOVEMENT 1 [Striga hermonthica]|uniref:Protein RESTRICTED TEV MOVEMENT 1 n=1 Tax=Striga hermonthica TaxID=68872 RepID=A0A9N7NRJ8_STRHE|nr:Protein RESTRICTED TEV MOVEMENT 1 [Striga hermonthica]
MGRKTGNTWDEKGRINIVYIFIHHAEEIDSIQFLYAEDGELVLSDSYGNKRGKNFDFVKLDYPAEYITSIRGRLHCHDNSLRSITFETNHGEYGPFGKSYSSHKEFALRLGDGGHFGGFHGTADSRRLKSIGVYFEPITSYNLVDNNSVKMETNDEKFDEC